MLHVNYFFELEKRGRFGCPRFGGRQFATFLIPRMLDSPALRGAVEVVLSYLNEARGEQIGAQSRVVYTFHQNRIPRHSVVSQIYEVFEPALSA